MSEHRRRSVKAYSNQAFLNSKDARALRILAEYLEPKSRFEHHRVDDTIVFMGSARIKPREQAEAALRQAQLGEGDPQRAQAELRMSEYYEAARELAFRLTEWSKGLDAKERRFVVCTGGGPGIMEAANRGAAEARGMNVGLTISIPVEEFDNRYVTRELAFHFHYFFMRKLWFAQPCRALIVFPGGFGTMDEMWEFLTLIQTHKMGHRSTILRDGSKFWKKAVNFDWLREAGTVNAEESKLIRFVDSPREAFETLKSALTRQLRLQPVQRHPFA